MDSSNSDIESYAWIYDRLAAQSKSYTCKKI